MQIEFEDQYLDVLQNIEWSLLSFIKIYPELTDYDILFVVEQGLTYYKFQQKENSLINKSKLTGIQQEIFDNLLSTCEYRLGQLSLPNKEIDCAHITVEELLLCLKRIRKSIKFWTKQGGRKGYINFAAPRALVSL